MRLVVHPASASHKHEPPATSVLWRGADLATQPPLPGIQFLDPAVLARIGNLELVARTVVEGFLGGLHRSPHLGTSVDFAEHRQYMPGDDIRRIDWRLYGRVDRYYITGYEADINTILNVLLDESQSKCFCSRAATNLDYARTPA